MDELEKIVLSGELYRTPDEDLLDKMLGHLEQVRRFNETPCTREGVAERARMAKAMFAEIGERCYIEPPLRSNWGCKHVHFGAGIYANSNLTLVDDAEIFVGDDTMFGPNVTVCTAAHPVAPELREQPLRVQPAHPHRPELLDRRGGNRAARREHRR